MYQCQTTREVIVGEVRIVTAQLTGGQHTFIYNVGVRERADVEILILHAVLYLLAHLIEDTLKLVELVVGDASNEHLLDVRLYCQCTGTESLRSCRHVTQMHQSKTLTLYLFNHDRENLTLTFLVFWKENDTRAVFSLFRHRDTLKKNKLVRYLKQDTSTVARLVTSLCTTMLHILEHAQCVVYQVVAFVTVDVNHHAYATSVMLIRGIIQSISHIK